MIREPARSIASAVLESISLLNLSRQGNLDSIDYQTDSLVYNIETVSFPRPRTHKLPLPKKYVNHKNLLIIPTTGGCELSHEAPDPVSQNTIPNKILVVSPRRRVRRPLIPQTNVTRNLIKITSSSDANAITESCSSKTTLKFGFLNIRSLSTKALLINDLILQHDLDMIGLCETWLKPNVFLPLNEASPPNFTYAHVARATKQGGGVALVYKSLFNLSSTLDTKFNSFESLVLKSSPLTTNCRVRGSRLHLVVLYRPPGPYSQFLEEFGEFLSDIITHSDEIVIIGDFNIHLNKADDPLCKAFLALLDTFGFIQSVHEPTHSSGNTLDLILSRGIDVTAVTVSPVTSVMSDHFLIKFEASSACPRNTGADVVTTRHIGPSTITELGERLPVVLAPFTTATGPVENCTNDLNTALSNLLDSVAPLTTKTRRSQRSTPWFNDETRALKQACRRSERKWRKSKLEVNYLPWHECVLIYKRALSAAKTAYFSRLISNNKHNPRFLFDTVAKLTQKQPTTNSSSFTAHDFLDFFCRKIDEIRYKISSSLPATSVNFAMQSPCVESQLASVFTHFETVSLETLSKLVSASKPTTCLLDPLPAKLFKDLWPWLGPTMLNIVNVSLTTGTVPTSFKTAIVKPLLKKTHLDPGSLNNYRPVSNLPFFSKVLERVVSQQLSDHILFSDLFEPFQSAFRACHSTETALTKVVNDLLLNMDSDSTSVLLLLDLSAAFDTIDHRILLDRLENTFGISGLALAWLQSYLSERTQCVSFNNSTSIFSEVKYGVPQGSVLGPLLFSLYIAPLGQIIRSYGIDFHCYADDTQLYLPIKAEDRSQIVKLEACLSAVKNWMSSNFLLLNSDKTEMLVIGPARHRHKFDQVTVTLDNCVISQSSTVKNLGVMFDSTLSFDQHIKDITKIAFFHLRNIAKIRSSLSMADAEILIHAFVSSRLDYCNALLSGLPRSSTRSLQMVQNTAARILTKTRKFDHITPVLASLHWLPIHVRSDFKVLLMTYKIVNGYSPSYLSDLLKSYTPTRTLRSQNTGLLSVPRVKKKSAGERAFSYRAPFLWNNLPIDIRQSDSVEVFKSKLKTHLFALTFN